MSAPENGAPYWRIVPPSAPGCLCDAFDYEAEGPCPLPGHDPRVIPPVVGESQ